MPAAQAQRKAADEAGADRDELAARQVSAWRQRITARPSSSVGLARGRDVEVDVLVEPWAVLPQVVPDIDHKPSGAPQWNVDDWRADFDERVGLVDLEGGPGRTDAEARATACCVAKWLNRHPVRSLPGRCHACRDGPEREALVPFGTQTNTGHVWLHGLVQAGTLDAIFNEMARGAAANMGRIPPPRKMYLRLALKAQSQCRATLETLAASRNPPIIFAKQANVTTGPQQINNGATVAPRAPAAKNSNQPIQLSGVDDEGYPRTPEHRALRSQMIRQWKPWQRSTGPKTPEGKATSARRGFKGGERAMLRDLASLLKSQATVLKDTC